MIGRNRRSFCAEVDRLESAAKQHPLVLSPRADEASERDAS